MKQNNMLRKVVIIGPESTGKSTLAENLAANFNCPWVQEYAREYLQKLNRPYQYEDLLAIAKGQIAEENEKSLQASKFLICDTDLHVVKVWSEHRFGKVHSWITEMISFRKYDLYLLTDIDIPWQDDPQREHPEPKMRKHFFDIYLRILQDSGIPFAIISGNENERSQRAIDVLNQNLI